MRTLLALLTLLSLSVTAEAQTQGFISGRVTDEVTGNPIANALVFTREWPNGPGIGGAATTDALGFYTTDGRTPGTYAVYVSVPGQNYIRELYLDIPCPFDCPPTGAPVQVQAGATTGNIDFALAIGGIISGTITSAATGTPLGNVKVKLWASNGVFLDQAVTNASGVYAINRRPTASYFVSTDANPQQYIDELYANLPCSGFSGCAVTSGTPIPVTAGATTSGIDFALDAASRITGVVTATGGAPIAGASVVPYTLNGVRAGYSVDTDGSGAYALPLFPGSYLVVVEAFQRGTKLYDNIPCSPGCPWASGTPVLLAAGNDTAGINFVMDDPGSISGFVWNAVTGAPIANLSVSASLVPGVYSFATTNQWGGYLFGPLAPGQYQVQVSSGFFFGPAPPQTVTVTPGATTSNVNFLLPPNNTGIVVGLITNDLGIRLPAARVELVRPDGTVAASGLTYTGGCDECGPAGEYFLQLAAGTYQLRVSAPHHVSQVFNGVPCVPDCAPTAGTPVVVAAETLIGRDVVLMRAGAVAGRVTDAASGAGLEGVTVYVYRQSGALSGFARTNGAGDYFVNGLTAGTYFARSGNTLGYRNEIYNDLPFCQPTCQVTDGQPIVVTTSQTTGAIDFALTAANELIQNGDFSSGLSPWGVFATPDSSYIVWDVASQVFRFYRVPPPPGTANQAVVLQYTGVPLATGTPLVAEFDLANTGPVRKRITILIHDADFSDLATCTFWLPANTPRIRYGLRAHTTKAWANATIAFYAASAGENGGRYEIDNVSLQVANTAESDHVNCLDPLLPDLLGGVDGPDLIVNGGFSSGAITPGWGVFGQIQWQVSGGVFEFIKLPGAPAGVVLQPTGQTANAGDILTATFQLGNSSTVRKRVTVILHDYDFSDLSACTFWIPAGQPLSPYTFRTFTTKPWITATIAFYPSTVGVDQWIQLDDVTLKRTPSVSITGTECAGPAAGPTAGLGLPIPRFGSFWPDPFERRGSPGAAPRARPQSRAQ